jgi:hypothetical protein
VGRHQKRRLIGAWGFAMSTTTPEDPEVARVHDDALARCDHLFRRAREPGVLPSDSDLCWVRRVYYVIHGASQKRPDSDGDVEGLAARAVDTLLHGVGAPAEAAKPTPDRPPGATGGSPYDTTEGCAQPSSASRFSDISPGPHPEAARTSAHAALGTRPRGVSRDGPRARERRCRGGLA